MEKLIDPAIILKDGDIHGHHTLERFLRDCADSKELVKGVSDFEYNFFVELDLERKREALESFSNSIDANDIEVKLNDIWYHVSWNDGDIIATHPEAEFCETVENNRGYYIPAENYYEVDSAFAIAIINDDYSGLEERDRLMIVGWLHENPNHYCLEQSTATHWGKCDISGLQGELLKLVY